MTNEQFPTNERKKILEIKNSSAAENKTEIGEKEIDESIKENPDGFVGWFEDFKNSITGWPKKFFENKTIKNAVVCASIPFAILTAGKLEAGAEDIASKFIHTPTISEKTREPFRQKKLEAKELIALKNEGQKEILAKRINLELNAFDKLSEPFNKAAKENINLFPDEVIEKISNSEKVFDFAGRIRTKINETNLYFKEISETSDDLKSEKRTRRVKKILDDGKLNFKELAKVLPEIVLAQKMSVLVHEIGHEEEALKQGAISAKTTFNLFGGYTEYQGQLENKAAFNAAGINADKSYGEFLVNNLRDRDAPSQLMAIMALVAKSDGMFYALSTNFAKTMKEHKGNDIIQYAKNTNTSVSELALGLAADFLLDKDNWKLLNIALGKEGVKIPRITIAPMYELGQRKPIIGIKIKGVF